MSKDIPHGYEYGELPEDRRTTWDIKQGGLFAIVLGGMLFIVFTNILSLLVRSIIAIALSILGFICFWRHRHGGQRCPRCEETYSKIEEGYSENTFFICDNCRVYWDTGRSGGTGGD